MSTDDIARLRIVEDIVDNVGKAEARHNLQDLCQDIYEQMVTKDREKIEKMSYREVKYYISRIATNSIHSKTSRYHYRYRLPRMKEQMIMAGNKNGTTNEKEMAEERD